MPRIERAEPQPVVLPSWGDFKLAMLRDEAYQRIVSATAAQRAVSRVESLFTAELDNWDVCSLLWRQMLMGCDPSVMPTSIEVATWRAIAFATNMPINFDEQGYLEPKPDDS